MARPSCQEVSFQTLFLQVKHTVLLLWLLALCWLPSSRLRGFPLADRQGSFTSASCGPIQTYLLGPFSYIFQFCHLFIQLLWHFSLWFHSPSSLVCIISSHLPLSRIFPLTLSLTLHLHLTKQDSLYQKHLGTRLFSPPDLSSPKLQKLTNL